MPEGSNQSTVAVTAGKAYDLSEEKAVFDDLDVNIKPVDIESPDDLRRELRDADAVIDRLITAPYTEDVIESAPDLKVIGRGGIGVDNIDSAAAAEQGVYVVNVPEYCQDEVSEHTLLFILALQRNLTDYNNTLEDGVWNKQIGEVDIHRLQEQTLGIVGFGSIARRVASKAQSLGIEVVASDPHVSKDVMAEYGVTDTAHEELLETADFVSPHVPLTDETEDMFGLAEFKRMAESAYFINVSRGGLVVEEDLAQATSEGMIAGAAIDVHQNEPPDDFDGNHPEFKSPLRDRDDIILTPHVAWYSEEAAAEKHRTVAMDVRRVLEGEEPENPVNSPE